MQSLILFQKRSALSILQLNDEDADHKPVDYVTFIIYYQSFKSKNDSTESFTIL